MSFSALDKDAKLNWMGHLLGGSAGFKLAYRLPAGAVLDAAMSAQVLLSETARARSRLRAVAPVAVLVSLLARARAILRAGAWAVPMQLLMAAKGVMLFGASVALGAVADTAASALRAIPARVDMPFSWLLSVAGRVEARARAAVDASSSAAARAIRLVYALLTSVASVSSSVAALRARVVRPRFVLVMRVVAKPYFLYWHLHRHVRRTVGWPLKAMRRRV